MDVQNEINELRRKLIAQLSAEREKAPERRTLRIPAPPVNVPAISDPARIYQVRTAEQLTPELAELKRQKAEGTLPPQELKKGRKKTKKSK